MPRDLFLTRLAGVTDPEQKRKIIGATFIDVFETTRQRAGRLRLPRPGHALPGRHRVGSVDGPSAVIKSHHNVGGLPERMQFKLVEPLRELFKDEVRRVGARLGLTGNSSCASRFPAPASRSADRRDHA